MSFTCTDPRPPSPFGFSPGGIRLPDGRVLRPRACDLCHAPAKRGQLYCQDHGPRRETKRKNRGGPGKPRPWARYALWEGAMLHRIGSVPVLAQWPPVVRIQSMRALSRPVPLRDIVETLIRRALGDPTAWPALERRMKEAGVMLPGDPPLPTIAPEDWTDDAP